MKGFTVSGRSDPVDAADFEDDAPADTAGQKEVGVGDTPPPPPKKSPEPPPPKPAEPKRITLT